MDDHILPDDFLSWILLDADRPTPPVNQGKPSQQQQNMQPDYMQQQTRYQPLPTQQPQQGTQLQQQYHQNFTSPMMMPQQQNTLNHPQAQVLMTQPNQMISHPNQIPQINVQMQNQVPMLQQTYLPYNNSPIMIQQLQMHQLAQLQQSGIQVVVNSNNRDVKLEYNNEFTPNGTYSINQYTQPTPNFAFTVPQQPAVVDLKAPPQLLPAIASRAHASVKPTTSNDIKIKAETQEEKNERLKKKNSRNPELAKASRKRQRDKVEEMEKRIKELSEENKELNAHLLNVTQRTTEVQKQRVNMEKLMSVKVEQMDDKTDRAEIDQLVRKFVSLYADYGEYRRKEVSFHLDQLAKLVVPTSTTKMCVWTLQQQAQNSDVVDEAKSSLFQTVSKLLEITPEQATEIKSHRQAVQSLIDQLQEALALIQKLRVAIDKKHSVFDSTLGFIQAQATSPQIVRFLLWITKNAEKLSRVIPDFERSVPHLPQPSFLNEEGKQMLGTSFPPFLSDSLQSLPESLMGKEKNANDNTI